jgi:hypothetical protein
MRLIPTGLHHAPLGRTSGLLLASMCAFLLLSAPTLAALGIPYDIPQGSFPAKIHPGTYLLALTCLSAWADARFGWQGLRRACQGQPLLAAYLLCMLSCFVWAVARHGPAGLAFYIDTLLTPAVAGLLLMGQPDSVRSLMLQLIMAVLLLNAALALAEYVGKAHLVPGVMGASEADNGGFFRSAALLGHPLSNAKITVAALPFATRLPWPSGWRVLTAVTMALALLSFGGRTSLAVGGLFYGGALMAWLFLRLLEGRFNYLQLTGAGLGGVLLMATVATGVIASGLGDRVFQNFTWDNSADVRFVIWRTLDHFHDLDLWMGLPIPGIDQLAGRVGIDMRFEAIENFWLYQFLLLGIVGFVPFVLGMALMAAHLLRHAQAGLGLAVIVYFVVASGTNSLASKTISLLVLTVLVTASQKRGTPRLAQRGAAPLKTKAG